MPTKNICNPQNLWPKKTCWWVAGRLVPYDNNATLFFTVFLGNVEYFEFSESINHINVLFSFQLRQIYEINNQEQKVSDYLLFFRLCTAMLYHNFWKIAKESLGWKGHSEVYHWHSAVNPLLLNLRGTIVKPVLNFSKSQLSWGPASL